MVEPMKAAFRRGDREEGVRTFIDYVKRDPHAWEMMPPAARTSTLENAREWDVTMTTGELFPEIDPAAVSRIQAPVLLLSGAKTYPFLVLIDQELGRLLPHNRRVVLPDASHAMWYEQPEAVRRIVLDFLRPSTTAASRGR
jgi:pimeloyl-ACP methyl ester carboxylesterase